ncbi:MAG: sulfatase-like hydrolase/transferase [Planctomycetes bacterium]|nr:sulfatase-like hydrolase/transferase [Planctomycetota bacterium]
MDRRDFLKSSGLFLASCGSARAQSAKRPNILVILTDQQSATMMSCAGNKWLSTPAMDSLMKNGMRFEKAYAANPVCSPSRFSMMTGFYPSAVAMRENAKSEGAERFVSRAMGHIFQKAGYETVYGGKVHLPGAMRKITDCGFRNLTGDQRAELAEVCARYIKGAHDKPFLLVASFINPHDICFQAIQALNPSKWSTNRATEVMHEAEKIPDGVSRREFFEKLCPPLRENYEPTKPEPKGVVALLKTRDFRWYVRQNWTDEDWRIHRWTYARLTERVDGQIGIVLDALRQARLEDDTVVIFTSDHGDMDGAHRIEHKSHSYEEAARIPLIVRYPGVSKPGHVDSEHLVSNGLDLLPTLCDIAGIEHMPDLPGRSVKPLLGGKSKSKWRKYLMIETELSRAITDGRYKYTLFDAVDNGEMLCDLKNDPGEMKNLAPEKECADVLNRMRAALVKEAKRHGVKLAPPS